MRQTKGPAQQIDRGTLAQLRAAHKRRQLTRQQFRTLYGQVISGDAEGAKKGLRKLLLLQGSNAVKSN